MTTEHLEPDAVWDAPPHRNRPRTAALLPRFRQTRMASSAAKEEASMSYAQSPPIVEREWLTEGISVDGPARDVDARSHQRIGRRGINAIRDETPDDAEFREEAEAHFRRVEKLFRYEPGSWPFR